MITGSARYQKRARYLRETGTPLTVPNVPTVRRIRALQALGWTVNEIAAATGTLNVRTLHGCLRVGTRVRHATAEGVEVAYTRLHMTAAPDSVSSRRARAMAERRGWAPPLAWDDIDHDSAPVPGAYSRDLTRDERLTLIQQLRPLGYSLRAMAELCRVSRQTILADIERINAEADQ